MKTKQMTLCRVKLKWRGEKILNWKDEEILPVRSWNGRIAVSGDPMEVHPSEFRQRAAQMALEEVIGPPEYQRKVNAEVVSVDILGLVMVEDKLGEDIDEILSAIRENDTIVKDIRKGIEDINKLLDKEGIKPGNLTDRVKELIDDNGDLRKQIEDTQP